MNYNLRITAVAERDLVNAADYIEFTLKNPTAADNLLDLVDERITELKKIPEVHPVVDDPVLSAWGIRYLVINNYLAFYTLRDDTIFVVRFLYGKRDWISILKQGFTLN